MNDKPILSLHGVRRVFDAGRVVALQDVNLAIAPGEFVALRGPSGCGKSTLLHLLGALDEPDAGEVCFDGTALTGRAARRCFRSRQVGFIFQSFHLLPTLTALENVQIPMFEMPWSGRERQRRAEALLGEVGLQERQHHRPNELSGGERQRVAAARSLANRPRILLADEPTGNLDSASAARLLELLTAIQREHGLTLVMATHDSEVAGRASRCITMRDGRILAEAPPDPT